MVSAGSYILSAALLAALILSLGFSAYGLRRQLLPSWSGSPARLVEAVVGVALLVWLSELLGLVSLLYAGTLVAAAALVAAAVALGPRVLSRGRGAGPPLGFSPPSWGAVRGSGRGEKEDAAPARHPCPAPPAGEAREADAEETRAARGVRSWLPQLIAVAVVAVVFAHWGLTTKDALDRGVFNFDSLWYHLPFATDIAQTHSVTQFFHPETVFTNWFYPQNSELLHATGILLTERDTLSLFVNFGWLAIAFLAAWCIGRPWGRGSLAVVAAAIVLDSHTLVVREPGAAKNDLMAAALLLAAIAILVNRGTLLPRVAWGRGPLVGRRPVFRPNRVLGRARSSEAKNPAPAGDPSPATGPAGEAHGPAATGPAAGMPSLAVAGLATGLAVGTKSTAVAMAAALTVAVVFLAPAGRRWAAAGWWFVPALAGGGYWYLRNLIAAGNPLPQLESLGTIPLPHPERLQSGRPDFSVAHYATDTTVWHEYFAPGLHNAFGPLWPLVIIGAVAGALVALVWGRRLVLRWMGAVALLGMVAYLFTPLSAAGAEGAPVGFAINIRYAIPALLAGLALLPIALLRLRAGASASPAGGVGEGGDAPSAGGVERGSRGGAASSFSPQEQSRTAVVASGEKPSAAPGPPLHDRTRGRSAWSLWDWALLAVLLVVWVVTDRPDAVLRDPDRLFAFGLALLFVLIPAAILWAHEVRRKRLFPAGGVAGGTAPEEASATAGGGGYPAATGPAGRRAWSLAVPFVALGIAILAIGYPVQRDYLRDRYLNTDPETSIPGMHLDSAYRWARGVRDARVGLAGTTAGFLEYGFYGTDLSNRVRYLGIEGPHGAFDAIPTCRRFRAAVNAADLDYLVTAPFLNFIHPGEPIASPEAGWLRGEPAVTPVVRSGPATVWKVRGGLDPAACGPRNAPLRRIPDQLDR